ncbi:MAG: SusD/RagB family nutrient-binding outer membrane lipoprotein [Bacteroidia bacterium]|nr:SusD/RagB family nutrient-binding outer membrane lipoprotein [Bacteroidia bacterium]
MDPTRETEASLKEMLPAAIVQTYRNNGSIGARVSGIVIQHFKGIDAQPESYSSYLIDSRTLDVYWRLGIYAGALKDCNQLITISRQEEVPFYEAIASILSAYNLGIASTYWGDIPWSQAFQPNLFPQPVYDSQESIFEEMDALLDRAITLLTASPQVSEAREDDLIFKGNHEAWIKTAWALKARYALQRSKRDNQAASKALQYISASSLTSIEDQARLFYGSSISESNPLTLYSIERPNQIVLGDFLLELLVERHDPRLNAYAALSEDIYRIYQEDNDQIFWGQMDAPVSLISLSEVKFIAAEAHLRLGEEVEAEQAFKEAVWSNFEELGLSSDPLSSQTVDIEASFDGLTSFEEKLERIITQKYIAAFGQGIHEAWVDYRRTSYPNLQVPENVNSSFNPSLVIPQRYLYPISESNTNSSNMQTAIARQGGHLLDNQLWLFE